MNKTINKKKVFKIISIFLVLIIILVVSNVIMSTGMIYGKLNQTITLQKGQTLKLVDENITLKIVDFDAEDCGPGIVTSHACTDVYIKIEDNHSTEKCSMWFTCGDYKYIVQNSDYKTYAKIKVIKSDE